MDPLSVEEALAYLELHHKQNLEDEVEIMQSAQMAAFTLQSSITEFIECENIEAVTEISKQLEMLKAFNKQWSENALKLFNKCLSDSRNRYEEWKKANSKSAGVPAPEAGEGRPDKSSG
jgi:hypothetical protein